MSSAQVYLVGKGENERSIRVRRIADTSAGGVRYGLSINDGPEFEVDAARPVEDVLSGRRRRGLWNEVQYSKWGTRNGRCDRTHIC